MTGSLQFRLSVCLSMLVVAIATVGGVIAFKTAFHEANELQDGQLLQISALVTPRTLEIMEREALAHVAGADHDSKLIIQTVEETTPLLIPPSLPDGLQSAMVDGTSWRFAIKTLENGSRVVVGQKTAGRDEIARNSALSTVMPFAALALILVGALHLILRHMFRPLLKLATDLDRRAEHDLSPVSSAEVPNEIAPFVTAINRLLSRVEASIAAQRRFVADAAHELRSPLTALSLQVERLSDCELSDAARGRLAAVRSGLARSRSLLTQLLTLARVQNNRATQNTSVRVQEIFRNVLEDLMPLAEAKCLDIGVSSTDEVDVDAPQSDLSIMIKNLVDNAIRYAPKGGRVDLSTGQTEGKQWIRIEDTGPGIEPAERARVFDPFYRVLGTDADGSGLGLSIVATIAQRIGAHVELAQAAPHGLVVTVTMSR
ncbi:ATP-binding protein [Caballeronia cordobensis]|uniref:ATP-binding protein n=1 Tax=Caballeronia cordobensis TaxID=1353886 RepID=UPI00045EF665|nr:sensory histidine kinase [Burkholderia sp. RPE67]